MIADFGISRLLLNSVTLAGTSNLQGNVCWMAPELLDVSLMDESATHQLHTRESDVWAFGMVISVRYSSMVKCTILMVEL